jgi:hypothetical protein
MNNEIEVVNTNKEISVQLVKQQFDIVNELYKQIMIPDEHYGKIPGTKKDTLFKAGAEKLNILFKLVPKIEREDKIDLGNGHREIEMVIGLYHRDTEKFWGQGTGSCSTMESKYRYRSGDNFEVTDEIIPKDAKEKKAEYRKQGYGMKKIDGMWAWVKYLSDDKVENPDIADVYNTVRKMAYKRALVSATITATGVSDIFTQDIEDFKQPEKTEYIPLDKIKDEFQGQEIITKDQAKAKLEALPQNIKDGFKALGYTANLVWEVCTEAKWDNNKIMDVINTDAEATKKNPLHNNDADLPEGFNIPF